jgi:ArsR family transcriptional regulator, nickel/cobalt-responsive transcriptional repressor
MIGGAAARGRSRPYDHAPRIRRGPEDTQLQAADPPPRDQLLSAEAAERLADTMFALATPSRLQILFGLRAGPLTVSQIISAVGMKQSAVSHQLRVLRDHGVVSVRRQGRERLYSLRDEHVAALLDDARRHVLVLEHGDDGTSTARSVMRRGATAS